MRIAELSSGVTSEHSVRKGAPPAFNPLGGIADVIEWRVSGQWRVMRDGNGGIPGNRGNVVSASCRF
jgi:hypothetical protein